jgi:hypothetical protein
VPSWAFVDYPPQARHIRRSKRVPTLVDTIGHIVGHRPHEEMVRVDAGRVIAVVTGQKISGDRLSGCYLNRNAWSFISSSRCPKLASSTFVFRCLPRPTRGWLCPNILGLKTSYIGIAQAIRRPAPGWRQLSPHILNVHLQLDNIHREKLSIHLLPPSRISLS